MKKIADLDSEYFYGLDTLFEYSRQNVYKSPFIVLIMCFTPLLLKIFYGQTFVNSHNSNLALKIFFIFMSVFYGIQSVLSICLFVNIKLKKIQKALFSIFYFVFVMSIILTTCLILLSSIVYTENNYYLFIIILAYISCIIFFIIRVCKERKKIVEGYYLKKKKKKNKIDVKKLINYFIVSMIPVMPFYILSIFKRTKFIENDYVQMYVLFGLDYLSILMFIFFGIFLAKEVFYIYCSFKFKNTSTDNKI